MGLLRDIYVGIFQNVLLISHLYSFVLVSYTIQESPFIFLVISGVSRILWHLSESALLTDFQEIKPKYLKINSTASKNHSMSHISSSVLLLQSSPPGSYVQTYNFFWQESSELHWTESTYLLFNLFILLHHLQLPRNCGHRASLYYVWPDPEQSQGNTQRSSNGFGRNSFHLYRARNIREQIHVMNMNQSYGKYYRSRIPLQRCWKWKKSQLGWKI